MDEATAKKLASLLTQILRQKGNSANTIEEVNHKVDQLLEFAKNLRPTTQGIELKAVYECEVAANKQPPKSGSYQVMSAAHATLKGSSPISLDFTPNVYVVPDKDNDNAAIVAETFVLPNGTIQGQPIQLLDGVTGADVKMLWDGGDWCGRATGALVSMWVNGYRVLTPTNAITHVPAGGYADIESAFTLEDQLKTIK